MLNLGPFDSFVCRPLEGRACHLTMVPADPGQTPWRATPVGRAPPGRLGASAHKSCYCLSPPVPGNDGKTPSPLWEPRGVSPDDAEPGGRWRRHREHVTPPSFESAGPRARMVGVGSLPLTR